jgi:hypothetical protein
MLTLEYKLRGSQAQFAAIGEAIRTVQFIRNTCLRLWMDGRTDGRTDGRVDQRGITANDLQAHCAVLASKPLTGRGRLLPASMRRAGRRRRARKAIHGFSGIAARSSTR